MLSSTTAIMAPSSGISFLSDAPMGRKLSVTYILESENGASLRASGWKCVGQAGGLRWTGERRPEVDLYPAQMKIRFEKEENDGRG